MDKEKLYRKLIIEKIETGGKEVKLDRVKEGAERNAEIINSINELIAEGRITATLVVGEDGELWTSILVDMEKVDIKLLEEITKDYRLYKIIMKVVMNENVSMKVEKVICRKELPSNKSIKEGLEGSKVIKDIKVEAIEGNVIDHIKKV